MSTARVPVPPGYQDSPKHRGTLVKHAREALAAAGHPGDWHVQHFDGQVAVMALAPAAHPEKAKIMLAPNFTLIRAPEVLREAKDKGYTVVEFVMDLQPGSRYAVAARVTPAVAVLRDRLAMQLGKHGHEIDLNATFSPEGHTEKIWVRRLPGTIADEKIIQIIWTFIEKVPGGNRNWDLDLDLLSGIGTLAYRKPERLPDLVALRDILPTKLSPEEWYKLSLGVDSSGELMFHDLRTASHQLVSGPTGSGKSIALLALLTSALARGHRFVMIEPVKGGPDYQPLRPYATAWAETLPTAQRTLELLYAEAMRRRKIVIGQYQKRKWSDVPAAELAKHDIFPMTVLIDEYGSLSEMEETYKSLPKDHELNVEANETNTHKAIIKGLTRKLSKEARAWGIHLQIALQRPTAEELGSGLRAQLVGRTQLAPPKTGLTKTDLGLVFTAGAVESATERIETLDHGGRLGLAIIQGESGLTRGLRVAYCEDYELVPLMDAIGVPRIAQEWDVGGEPTTDPSVLLTDPDFAPDEDIDPDIDPNTGEPWPF